MAAPFYKHFDLIQYLFIIENILIINYKFIALILLELCNIFIRTF